MKIRTVIRTTAFLLLFAYLLALACYLIKIKPDAPSDIQIKTLRAQGYFSDGLYTEYLNEYVNYLLIFIPVGLLCPFARGKKCLSLTIIFSIMLLVILECVKIVYFGGVISIDDEIWMIAGSLTGYGFYDPICTVTGLKGGFVEDGDNGISWIAFALLFSGMIFLLKYRSEQFIHDNIQEAPAPPAMADSASSVSADTGTITDKEIYNKLLNELSAFSNRIIFTDSYITPQILFDQFILVMEDHPELFYLTGGAKAETIVSNLSRTTIFLPEYKDGPDKLPEMVQALDAETASYLLECPDGSEYDKALWVHDRIIENTIYDSDILYYSLSVDDDSHFDYAYTSYGALVLHKAVCAGYARAYQLIMNKMGIECGYVKGNAINSHGETESHAWNYIRLDGQYYFTDVTWDDPVNDDYEDSGRLSHDFFCLSGADMGKDHFPDPDQFLPECPETRSPY